MNPRTKASEIIDTLHITSPTELKIELIANYFNIIVEKKVLEGATARLTCIADYAIITIAISENHESRIRFSIAHELGHFFLHRNKHNLFRCTPQYMLNWHKQNIEYDANIFASYLLMPDKLFKPAIKNFEPTIDNFKKLATQFCTSISATLIRFIELTIEPCAMFCVLNKKIKWIKKNKNFYYYTKALGATIEEHSYSYDCFQNKQCHLEGLVPAYAWINDNSVEQENMIYECSFYSPIFNTTYSLIWINEYIEKT